MDRGTRRHRSIAKYNKRKRLWKSLVKQDTSNWYGLKNHCKGCGCCDICKYLKLAVEDEYLNKRKRKEPIEDF